MSTPTRTVNISLLFKLLFPSNLIFLLLQNVRPIAKSMNTNTTTRVQEDQQLLHQQQWLNLFAITLMATRTKAEQKQSLPNSKKINKDSFCLCNETRLNLQNYFLLGCFRGQKWWLRAFKVDHRLKDIKIYGWTWYLSRRDGRFLKLLRLINLTKQREVRIWCTENLKRK